jgi:dephospho-CoA kinase
LRKDLFAADDFRQKVNSIIHPLVKTTIIAEMNNIVVKGDNSRVLVEIPLLYEVQWESLFDTVVVVYADYEICLNRLMKRDGVKRRTASKELESQMPLSEKAMKADYVIDNSGMLSDTNKQVQHLADLLKNNGKEEEKA